MPSKVPERFHDLFSTPEMKIRHFVLSFFLSQNVDINIGGFVQYMSVVFSSTALHKFCSKVFISSAVLTVLYGFSK